MKLSLSIPLYKPNNESLSSPLLLASLILVSLIFCFTSLSTTQSCFVKLNWRNSRRSVTSERQDCVPLPSDAEFPEIKFILMCCFAFPATGHSDCVMHPCHPYDTAAGFYPAGLAHLSWALCVKTVWTQCGTACTRVPLNARPCVCSQLLSLCCSQY